MAKVAYFRTRKAAHVCIRAGKKLLDMSFPAGVSISITYADKAESINFKAKKKRGSK